MCAIMTWGAYEYFMHPIFVLKNGCDTDLNGFGLLLAGVPKCCTFMYRYALSTSYSKKKMETTC
jgi:hypothetical protein